MTDLPLIYLDGDLVKRPLPNENMAKPKEQISLTSVEEILVCKWIKKLKMSDVFASNLSRHADVVNNMIKGMKIHDYHVFMECLLSIFFRSLPLGIWKSLTELSHY